MGTRGWMEPFLGEVGSKNTAWLISSTAHYKAAGGRSSSHGSSLEKGWMK